VKERITAKEARSRAAYEARGDQVPYVEGDIVKVRRESAQSPTGLVWESSLLARLGIATGLGVGRMELRRL
jgi:hypothetical protein